MLLANSVSALTSGNGEADIRERLRQASRRMAQEAAALPDLPEAQASSLPEDLNQQLREITQRVLRDAPGLEGGFYFAVTDRFGGFA